MTKKSTRTTRQRHIPSMCYCKRRERAHTPNHGLLDISQEKQERKTQRKGTCKVALSSSGCSKCHTEVSTARENELRNISPHSRTMPSVNYHIRIARNHIFCSCIVLLHKTALSSHMSKRFRDMRTKAQWLTSTAVRQSDDARNCTRVELPRSPWQQTIMQGG